MLEENDISPQPMRRTTQLDFAVEALRNAILNGEVGLGERVNEVAFTTKWGISRTTFREALRQMEEMAQSSMAKITGGLGGGLPF